MSTENGKEQQPTRGRPKMTDEARASSHIHLRVSRKRKAAYVHAAQPGTLADWCFSNLDKAAEYDPSEEA